MFAQSIMSWWLWLRLLVSESWQKFARTVDDDFWCQELLPSRTWICRESALGGGRRRSNFTRCQVIPPSIKRAFTRAHFHQVINRKQHSLSVCASQLYELQSVSSSERVRETGKGKGVDCGVRVRARLKFSQENLSFCLRVFELFWAHS